jgi:hypothetical protein
MVASIGDLGPTGSGSLGQIPRVSRNGTFKAVVTNRDIISVTLVDN